MEELATDYGWFAERYHWPPSVVDEQPWWTIEYLPLHARAWDEVSTAQQERAYEKARSEAERGAR